MDRSASMAGDRNIGGFDSGKGLDMIELRKSPRIKAFKGARIVYGNGSTTRDCMVRNISVEGAKIVAEITAGIPDEFSLLFEDGSRRRCAVRWRKANELGVEFLDRPS